jgi:NTP pyrophosphatase (non-canonical NTP hydrolase)
MDSRIKTIADHYGYEAQSRQCMEECSELIQAINKLWRAETFDRDEYEISDRCDKVIEEMADVQITIWQMDYLVATDQLGLSPLKDVIDEKLERQMQRIKEETNV